MYSTDQNAEAFLKLAEVQQVLCAVQICWLCLPGVDNRILFTAASNRIMEIKQRQGNDRYWFPEYAQLQPVIKSILRLVTKKHEVVNLLTQQYIKNCRRSIELPEVYLNRRLAETVDMLQINQKLLMRFKMPDSLAKLHEACLPEYKQCKSNYFLYYEFSIVAIIIALLYLAYKTFIMPQLSYSIFFITCIIAGLAFRDKNTELENYAKSIRAIIKKENFFVGKTSLQQMESIQIDDIQISYKREEKQEEKPENTLIVKTAVSNEGEMKDFLEQEMLSSHLFENEFTDDESRQPEQKVVRRRKMKNKERLVARDDAFVQRNISGSSDVIPPEYLAILSQEILLGGAIRLENIHVIQTGSCFGSSVRFFSILNVNALEKQDIVEGSNEMEDYRNYLERGNLVAARGQSGIKLARFKIEKTIGGTDLSQYSFGWEVKNTAKNYRLYGKTCSPFFDERNKGRVVGVDFCVHAAKGIGH